MRLKILLFPLIIIGSVVFSSLYTWPAVQMARKTNTSNKILEGNLEVIMERKDNIRKLDQSIGENDDKYKFITENYIPREKYEDRTIHAIDQLAKTNMLSLVILEIKKEASNTKTKDDTEIVRKNIFSVEEVSSKDFKNGEKIPEIEAKSKLKTVSVKASVIGEYPRVKKFINSLARIEAMNEIVSLEMTPFNVEEKLEELPAEGQANKEEFVQANFNAEFYYTKLIRSENYFLEKVFSSDKLDFAKIDAVMKYTTSKVSNIENPEKGRPNPFIIPQ